MGKFFKSAGFDMESLKKDYLLPSLIVGPIVGTGITMATSDKKELTPKKLAIGVGAGVAGDALTGLAMGAWKQRKELMK